MEQDEQAVIHDDLGVVLHRSPRQREGPSTVVVAAHQMDRSTAQTAEDLCLTIGTTAVSEIAQMPDFVAAIDGGIPPLDHRFVHFGHVGEWTMAEADDVGVTEMVICREPEGHGSLPKCERGIAIDGR